MADSGETRVLIAMDGSKYADYAFDWYMEQLHRPADYVILFHAVEFHTLTTMRMFSFPPQNFPNVTPVPDNAMGVGAADLLTRMIDEEKAHAHAYLEKLTEKMKSASLHGKVKQVTGTPRTEVLKVAEEEKATLIITGTRGMGTVKRTFLGSVSDHILHHSHVPVLVCRHKDDHKSHGQHDTHM